MRVAPFPRLTLRSETWCRSQTSILKSLKYENRNFEKLKRAGEGRRAFFLVLWGRLLVREPKAAVSVAFKEVLSIAIAASRMIAFSHCLQDEVNHRRWPMTFQRSLAELTAI
ncbi:hypothetical protein HBI38_020020 [Parastagonospora nodorum]|nr:hypothetical protein HBI38_020020 [Parastagonospora nodorum]